MTHIPETPGGSDRPQSNGTVQQPQSGETGHSAQAPQNTAPQEATVQQPEAAQAPQQPQQPGSAPQPAAQQSAYQPGSAGQPVWQAAQQPPQQPAQQPTGVHPGQQPYGGQPPQPPYPPQGGYAAQGHGPQPPQWQPQGQPQGTTTYTAPGYTQTLGFQFTVGSILSRTLEALKQNLALYCILTLLAIIAPALLEGYGMVQYGLDPYNYEALFEPYGLALLLRYILSLLIQGGIAYAVYIGMRGDKATLGESLKHGFARFFPILFTSLLMFLLICAGVLGIILLTAITPILGILGGIAGLVLFVIMMIAWTVIIPACVVERLGPIASFKRSAALTKGYRGTIFGATLLATIVIGGLVGIASAVTEAILPLGIATVVAYLIAIVPMAYQSVMTASIYYDLRAVKEGVTVDKLVNVFD